MLVPVILRILLAGWKCIIHAQRFSIIFPHFPRKAKPACYDRALHFILDEFGSERIPVASFRISKRIRNNIVP